MSAAAPPRPPAPPGTGIPLDAIYDAIDHGIAIIDRSGRFVAANKAADAEATAEDAIASAIENVEEDL